MNVTPFRNHPSLKLFLALEPYVDYAYRLCIKDKKILLDFTPWDIAKDF